MRSPISIGRSTSRMMPLMKFRVTSCNPMPRPTPRAPAKIARAERSIPAFCTAIAMPTTRMK
jgi:hypothetical protein